MTEESHFLEALRARPDDTTLRLVYGDWLEERGDVRGEFIRLMEEMGTLPIYSDRFAELRPLGPGTWDHGAARTHVMLRLCRDEISSTAG